MFLKRPSKTNKIYPFTIFDLMIFVKSVLRINRGNQDIFYITFTVRLFVDNQPIFFPNKNGQKKFLDFRRKLFLSGLVMQCLICLGLFASFLEFRNYIFSSGG